MSLAFIFYSSGLMQDSGLPQNQAKVRKVIWFYYCFQFFFSLLLWLPIFYEYQKRIGLNDTEIFGIQSIYYLVFCLFEIPTGFAADRFGYLKCLKMGAIFLVISNLLPIFMQNYAGFLIHFIAIAFSRSLISGASSAYIYEYLQMNKDITRYKQIEGSARAYGLFGKVIFWAGIGALMEWHLTLPYWLTVMAALISVIFAFLLPDFIVKPAKTENRNSISRIKAAVSLTWKFPLLFFIMLQGIAIFVLARIFQVNLFQPILSSKLFGLSSFGMIMALMTIFEAIGSAKPSWLQRWLSDLNAVFFLTIVMAVSMAFIARADRLGTLIWICIFSYAMGLAFPIQRLLINEAIPNSQYRATLLSLESIFDRAVCAGVAPLIGVFLATNRLGDFLLNAAVVTVASMLILILVINKLKISLLLRGKLNEIFFKPSH